MAENNNGSFRRPLLGKGELLKEAVKAPGRNPGGKYHPFTPQESFQMLAPQASAMRSMLSTLPEAMRGQHVVFEAKLHPNYLASSYFPDVFDSNDLYVVGAKRSKGTYTTKTKSTEGEPTKTLIVAGTVDAVTAFSNGICTAPDIGSLELWDDARKLSMLTLPRPEDVIKRIPDLGAGEVITWEAVLNPIGRNREEESFFGNAAFQKWKEHIESLSGHVDEKYRREVRGLTFVPIALHAEAIEEAAKFNLLRALRPMPRIRPAVSQVIRAAAKTPKPSPNTRPTSDTVVAVFDGGVNTSLPAFSSCVTNTDLTTVANTAGYMDHGTLVTGALLYGPLDAQTVTLPVPRCTVDHYRVLPHPISGDVMFDEGAYWILDQIKSTLESGKYGLVNLSLGPDQSVEDDGEPDRWTSELDCLAEEQGITFVVAVGNNGHEPPEHGFNRVQVPADMANGIGVGACDKRTEKGFNRCGYSAIGPGRDGQRLQPAGVAFGGNLPEEPFYGLDHRGRLVSDEGTSYAAPTTAGGLAELSGQLGSLRAKPEVLRVFASHFAQRTVGHKKRLHELGHGRFLENYRDVWECAPNECVVLYEDVLERGANVSLKFPFPHGLPPEAKIQLRWHLAFMTPVVPGDSADYTTAGVTLVLRPHERRVAIYEDDTLARIGVFDLDRDADAIAQLARTTNLKFSDTPISVSNWRKYRTEGEQREAGKWETLNAGERRFSAKDLYSPRLDVSYLRREKGRLIGGNVPRLRIAMLLEMKAPEGVPLYDLVEQRYPLLVPVVTVPIRIHNVS